MANQTVTICSQDHTSYRMTGSAVPNIVRIGDRNYTACCHVVGRESCGALIDVTDSLDAVRVNTCCGVEANHVAIVLGLD
ncbi:MAG TPA: hypothetical protein VIP09_12205 [Dehalococcoidia bacterium]